MEVVEVVGGPRDGVVLSLSHLPRVIHFRAEIWPVVGCEDTMEVYANIIYKYELKFNLYSGRWYYVFGGVV